MRNSMMICDAHRLMSDTLLSSNKSKTFHLKIALFLILGLMIRAILSASDLGEKKKCCDFQTRNKKAKNFSLDS